MKNNWLESLKLAAATSKNVAYIRFLQQYSTANKNIHVFHEGKDDPSFYTNYIESKLKKNQRIFFYKALNKKNVYEVYLRIDWTAFNKHRVLFFVDKDLADILNESYVTDINIFVTKYYSIENYLVSESILRRCLIELIGVDEENKIKYVIDIYKASIHKFYTILLPIMSYIIYHKQRTNINLGNISLKHLCNIRNRVEPLRKKGLISELDNLCGVNTLMAYSDIKKVYLQLSEISNPKIYIRGKFEIIFFVNFVNNIPELLNSDSGENKYKTSIILSIGNAIQVLAPRLKVPADISKFINNNLKKN